MNVLNQVLGIQYDTILDEMDMGRLVDMASHGLLSQEQQTFKESHKVLNELFMHPSTSICKKRPETNSIVMRLYNSYVLRIVKNCIEVILTSRMNWQIKGCGDMLRIINTAERIGIRAGLKIEKGVLSEILESYSEDVNADISVLTNLERMLNASSKEEAEGLAVLINSKLYEA
ncbi:hypothetical protein RF11_06331 [Thelohanellus kitauei]|uniref:Uncharacterized protein n=1 Tax=Thelohanellus kitauei TaxID=669202 RepID=A0A0C2MJQ3_THEKT|nr:hypothetical protein RF11_06331 [Thelohanellus kitauei]